MKRNLISIIALFLLTACVAVNAKECRAASTEPDTAETAAAPAVKEEEPVRTQNSVTIDGKRLNYTAVAGKLPVTVDGKGCEIFYTAYTLDTGDQSGRPITFAFNGGPGSSSEWAHLAFLGPRRGEIGEEGIAEQFPVNIVNNDYSILDVTDLVFIDPVGTGYSVTAEGVDPDFFSGYDNDLKSVGEFIRLYINRNSRWGSPKYIAGESYGTTRAVGLADYLYSAYEMGVNGLLLVSSVNDFSILNDYSGSDLSCVLILPSYAAIAHYHGVLKAEYQNMGLEAYLSEVKRFAENEYQNALFKGGRLTESERSAIAEKISGYTGLKKDYVLKSNLRIFQDDFAMHVLEDKQQVVGQYDGRYTGPLTGKSVDDYIDPSDMELGIVFNAAINQYITEDLNYKTDAVYRTINDDVYKKWNYGKDNQMLDQKKTIESIMSGNKFLKVWVLCGYYDLATPFSNAEYTFNHVFLDDEIRKNLSFTYYPSGHMFYMYQPALEQFRQDALAWYGAQ